MFCLCVKCNFGHRRYYQANSIVIFPLNVINKQRWSTEYCKQKHKIIIYVRIGLYLCHWQLYRRNRSMLSSKWRQIRFYHSYSYISFHLCLCSSVNSFNVNVRTAFQCVWWAFPTTKIIEYSVYIFAKFHHILQNMFVYIFRMYFVRHI